MNRIKVFEDGGLVELAIIPPLTKETNTFIMRLNLTVFIDFDYSGPALQ